MSDIKLIRQIISHELRISFNPFPIKIDGFCMRAMFFLSSLAKERSLH